MVTLTLDRERRLRLTWQAVRRLKQECGLNLLMPETFTATALQDPETVTALLWACLLDEDPTITRDRVDGLLRLSMLPMVGQALADALAEALTEGDSADPSASS